MNFIKKNKIFFIMIILTIISCLPLFMKNLAYGGDLNFHLKRIEALVDIIRNNSIGYPIYYNYLNNYGYASGLFYPDLFLYIPAFLNFFGVHLFTSYKIFLFLIKFLSLVSIYYSVKGINKDKNSALIAMILYAFSSYCFIDMFERGALAETMTAIFIPIVIRGIYEILFGDCKKYYFLPLGMIGILFSHIISLYLVTFFLLIFVVVNIKKVTKDKLFAFFKSIIIFLLVGCHFLFPLIEQMISGKFYYNISENVLVYNNVPFLFLFFEFPYYSLMGYYLNRWYPCGIGFIYLYFVFYYFRYKEKFDYISRAFLYSGVFCLLFNLKCVLKIPIINSLFGVIQFPYRIYILATVLFIISFTRVFKKISIKKIFLISLFLFCFNLFYPFVNIRTSKLLDDEIMNGEYLPVEYVLENNGGKVVSNCKIKYDIVSGLETKIEYKIDHKNCSIEIPIIYYKGYNIKINGKDIFFKKSSNGLIEFETDIKEGSIQVYYGGTFLYRITKYISLFSLICCCFIFVRKFLYEKK